MADKTGTVAAFIRGKHPEIDPEIVDKCVIAMSEWLERKIREDTFDDQEPPMSEEIYRHRYAGIWQPELQVFRVFAVPNGTGWVDISFINDRSIRLGIVSSDIPGALTDVWLYEHFETALTAAYTWGASGLTGEPYGWWRHPASGRRRINGDHRQEFYQP